MASRMDGLFVAFVSRHYASDETLEVRVIRRKDSVIEVPIKNDKERKRKRAQEKARR